MDATAFVLTDLETGRALRVPLVCLRLLRVGVGDTRAET
jgi:hypothetical protein